MSDYPNEIKEFYYETLGWCGCGNPDEALCFMRSVLIALNDRSEDNRSSKDKPSKSWKAHSDHINALLPGMLGLSYLYMLDALSLTEHGGSINGSWLTDEGKRVLAMLAGKDLETAMDED